MGIPQAITDKIKELDRLIEKYPDYIPVPVLADFLHTKTDGIRAYLKSGNCPWGFSWELDVPDIRFNGKKLETTHKGSTGYKVPTVPFYKWFTGTELVKK